MSKFIKGFVIGGIIAGTYALLTAKKTGKQTQKDLSHQIDTTMNDVTTLKKNVAQLNTATKQLQHSLLECTPILKDIANSVSEFSKQNQPHINRINRRIETLSKHLKAGIK